MTRPAPVLMLGGYGSVGTWIVRMLRRLHPDLAFVIAGRDLEKAADFAGALGNASATTVDLERVDLGLPARADYGIVVTALRDHSLNTMRFAQARHIPYVGLSDGVFELGPIVTQFAHQPAAAPILLLGHSMGGVPSLVTLHCAGAFRRVDSLKLGLVFDPADPLGPASAADMERIGTIGPLPLVLHDGRWRWAGADRSVRHFIGVDGSRHRGHAVGLLDVLSLSASGAGAIRVDIAESVTASSRRGEPPSHEVIIESSACIAEIGLGFLKPLRTSRFNCG